ncbi:zinc-binding dehydrogenase [Prauserella flavalba]|nr:zinc-binding dehydrogenase [Prauserella flavalba]
MAATMRAAVPVDGAIEIREVPVPQPGPREVLVAVRAAGMNRADLLHRQGRYGQRAFRHPGRPDIAGMEMAGEVVAVGESVERVGTGDAVLALCAGAYAEYVAVDERLSLPAPAGSPWPSLAALPMALLTAFEALARLAGLRRGQRVLVTGATSSAGLMAVQLARVLGAGEVIGTTRSREAVPLLRRLGAATVVHDGRDLAGRVGDDGVDVVIDHVGGAMFEASVPLLRKGASVVSVGRLGGRSARIDLARFAGTRARLLGTTWKTQEIDEIADSVDALRTTVYPHVLNGELVPVVGRRIPFGDIASGYEHLTGPREPGKPVVVL